MSLLKELNRVYGLSKRKYERLKRSTPKTLYKTDEVIKVISRVESKIDNKECGARAGRLLEDNLLIRAENIDVMLSMMQDDNVAKKIKLIYVDPPFFSMANYDAVLKVGTGKIKHSAYNDSWQSGIKEYLKMMTVRLMLMRDLLASDGLIFIHLDWHSVHYVKIIMDEIFGQNNFVNEIVWQYKSGGSSKKRFSRKHDTILVYSKTSKYKFNLQQEKSYNRNLKPYRFKGVTEFKDDVGWYTMVNMKDVWSIDMVGRTSSERTGYATQKPEHLLERIVKAATDEGDLCADFFCGSGTLGVVASKLGRRFIISDIGRLATNISEARLIREGADFSVYDVDANKNKALKANIKMTVDDETYNLDKIKIHIDSVKLRKGTRGIDEKALANVIAKDSRQLVLSWSIDFNYDGNVHRPSEYFVRDSKGRLDFTYEGFNKSSHNISVKVTDIFGNVAQVIF